MSLLFALVSAVTATGWCSNCGPTAEVEPPVVALKVLVPDNAHASGQVPYRVLVANRSGATAFGVQVRLDLPEGATLQESDPRPEQVRNSLIWSLGHMPARCEREIRVLLKTKAEGPIDACFRVAFEHGVCVTTQASCKKPEGSAPPEERLPPPRSSARLAVVKTGPAAQSMSTPVAYSINVVNEGEVTLREVEVEDLIPPGSTYLPGSADNNGQLAGPESKKVVWRLGTLLPRESRTLTFKVRATAAGTLLNIARGRAVDPEGRPVSSQDSAATTQITAGAAMLYMEVRDSRDPLFVSEETTYSILVRNPGTAPAPNIRLQADVPAGMVVRRISPADDSGAVAYRAGEPRVTFAAFTLQPGQERRFEITAQAVQPGVMRFRSTLTSEALDPAKGPIIDEETTTVVSEKPPDAISRSAVRSPATLTAERR